MFRFLQQKKRESGYHRTKHGKTKHHLRTRLGDCSWTGRTKLFRVLKHKGMVWIREDEMRVTNKAHSSFMPSLVIVHLLVHLYRTLTRVFLDLEDTALGNAWHVLTYMGVPVCKQLSPFSFPTFTRDTFSTSTIFENLLILLCFWPKGLGRIEI